MDACKPNAEKSHAISRASSSASVDSRAASEGGVGRTSHSIQLSTGSFGNNFSLLDNAVVRLCTDPTLPRNLREPLRHWGNVVSLPVVANSETLVLPAIILTLFENYSSPRRLSSHIVVLTTMRRKIEASTLSKRKREIPISCSGQVGGSSSSADATSITTPPERFITFKLPDDLPTDEEIRQRATCRRMELCLMMKRNAELLSRLNLQMMNDVKIELQRRGQQNSEAYRRAEIMITKLEEILIAARALPLPSFGIATSNSADEETPGEGPPMNEVKTVAKYNTRKLKIGKQVTETSIVVAKKNPSSRR